MGDCGDDFNALKEYHRQRKRDIYEQNASYMETSGLQFTTDQSGSLRFNTPKGTVMFYPSTNKFMFRGMVKRGNAKAAASFIRSLL